MAEERIKIGVALFLTTLIILLAVAPGDVVKAAEGAEHRVVRGDDLHILAGYYFRDPRKWTVIYDLNRDKIDNPNHIVPEMALEIPSKGINPFPMPYENWRKKVRE